MAPQCVSGQCLKQQSSLHSRSRLLDRQQMSPLGKLPNWSAFPKFPCRVMRHPPSGDSAPPGGRVWNYGGQPIPKKAVDDSSWQVKSPISIEMGIQITHACGILFFVILKRFKLITKTDLITNEFCLIRNSNTTFIRYRGTLNPHLVFTIWGMDRYIWSFNHSIADVRGFESDNG